MLARRTHACTHVPGLVSCKLISDILAYMDPPLSSGAPHRLGGSEVASQMLPGPGPCAFFQAGATWELAGEVGARQLGSASAPRGVGLGAFTAFLQQRSFWNTPSGSA